MGELRTFSPTPRDQSVRVRLARVAERQFGRVSWSQLKALGVSKTTVGRWVNDGYLHRKLPGVYAVGYASGLIEADLAAALLYAGPGAALASATALWWRGLLNRQPSVIEVSTPRSVRSLPGVRIRRRRDLPRHWHRGLPMTTPSQALLDYAATARPDQLRFALANADYHHVLDITAIQALTGRGIAGSAKLNEALKAHLPQLAYTRSEGERRLLALCELHDLPLPQINVHLRGWLVDAVWPLQKVVVEIDGYDGHRSRAQLNRDHQRDLELRRAGYTVLRYTWQQLTHTPEAVAADLARVLQS